MKHVPYGSAPRFSRGLLIVGYIAFYLVWTDRIVIIRVLDGRRDMECEFSR
jgi:hypothetical protein